MNCRWCDEPLDHMDPGIKMHRECAVRAVFGPVAHQLKTCSCYGGPDVEEPAGLTRRQAAKAACDLARHMLATEGEPPN